MARMRRRKNQAWRHLCTEIGGELVEGGLFKGAKVQAQLGPWTITLDTHTVSNGHTSTSYTRMRAPYVSADGFRFTIYRKGLLSGLGKVLGMQDIEVGDPEFDEAFIIQGNDEAKIFALFADADLRALFMAQPSLRLTVKDNEGWFGARFPEEVDELHFQVVDVIDDVECLKQLFALFGAVLERLCQISAAYKRDPGLKL